jgi:hypothetical protein
MNKTILATLALSLIPAAALHAMESNDQKVPIRLALSTCQRKAIYESPTKKISDIKGEITRVFGWPEDTKFNCYLGRKLTGDEKIADLGLANPKSSNRIWVVPEKALSFKIEYGQEIYYLITVPGTLNKQLYLSIASFCQIRSTNNTFPFDLMYNGQALDPNEPTSNALTLMVIPKINNTIIETDEQETIEKVTFPPGYAKTALSFHYTP